MEKTATILIVDDDKTVIEQLVTHFRRRNYEPIATANPAVIEQTLKAFEVHLILLDLRMERLNGYEVLEKLKKLNIQIPVLIITAYFKDEREKLRSVGMTEAEIIEKPFRDFSKIEAKINQKLSLVVVPGEVDSDYEDAIYESNKTKVVLVDDESEINDFLTELLEARKYQVVAFERGDRALEYLLKNDCQVAVVDMKMPGLTGDRLIQEILKAKPTLKIIPTSGAYVKEIKEQLSKVGFDPEKLVTKPFDIPILVERIKVFAAESGTLGVSIS